VAFLRGINVGGGRLIKMADLKACLEQAGLKNVRTFIASGNVVFEGQGSEHDLAELIQKSINKTFGFPVDVLVKNDRDLEKLTKSIPKHWVNDKQMKCDVMLLWPAIDNKKILKQIPFTQGLEEFMYVPGAVIWQVSRDKAAKSRITKIVGTKIYKQMTVRNPNTIRKIYELISAPTGT
jgi:uncharacterized protein (DUF1697 family)